MNANNRENNLIPLPAYVSGVRVKFGGEDCIQIMGSNGWAYAYVPCGKNGHLYALEEAKRMVEGLNRYHIPKFIES